MLLLAFGFGSGLAPRAPGTFGTLVGVAFCWMLQGWSTALYVGVLVGVAAVGVPICGAAARRLGVHDHPGIVWDEIAGYLLTMLPAPPGWVPLLTGFVLFRLFDISKPWPVRWLDRNVGGGAGIMLDDLAAGFLAGGSMYLLYLAGAF